MTATWVRTHNPCTHCGKPADWRTTASVLHTHDDGTTAGLYCTAPECSDAETRAWKEATQ